MTLVRVERHRNGVSFLPVTKTGKTVARATKTTKKALYAALDRYVTEVLRSLTAQGLGASGYAHAIEGSYLRTDAPGSVDGWLPLEPWGFATLDAEGKPVMGDLGSTPTDARAKVLWAYQAPLTFDAKNGWHAVWEV
jgi:hypothetical protein